jgi:hypothetical protein
MLFITINYLMSRGLNEKLTSGSKYKYSTFYGFLIGLLRNVDFIGGFLMVLVGYLSSTNWFQGRRVTLIVVSIVVVIVWNLTFL